LRRSSSSNLDDDWLCGNIEVVPFHFRRRRDTIKHSAENLVHCQ
jgi:hypothetical protein